MGAGRSGPGLSILQRPMDPELREAGLAQASLCFGGICTQGFLSVRAGVNMVLVLTSMGMMVCLGLAVIDSSD